MPNKDSVQEHFAWPVEVLSSSVDETRELEYHSEKKLCRSRLHTMAVFELADFAKPSDFPMARYLAYKLLKGNENHMVLDVLPN